MSISDSPPPPPPPVAPDPAPEGLTPQLAPSPFARSEKPDLHMREVGGILLAAFLANLAARAGLAGLASTLVVVVIAGSLWSADRLQTRSSRGLIVAAVLLAPWLAVRAAPELTASTLAAIVVCVALAVGISRTGRLLDLSFVGVVAHVTAQALEWTYGLDMVQRFVRKTAERGQAGAALRGVVVAVPVIFVFGALLASADDVFASFLLLDDLPSMTGHVVLTLLFAVGLLGVFSRAAHETPAEVTEPRASGLAPLEVMIVLASLALLFAGFVITQVLVAVDGLDHVLRTEGLTQAEHARRGFFQLLWVAALSLGLLGVIRAVRRPVTETERDRFRPLALIVLALSLAIAGVALQRLLAYIDTFDLTPLRLWALSAIIWVAVTIVGYALSIAGVRSKVSWFPGFMVISAAAFVFAMNVVNPDATIAKHNIEQSLERGASELDVRLLGSLSDDAVPVVFDKMGDLPDSVRDTVSRELCTEPVDEMTFGPFGWNRSDRLAEKVYDDNCASPRPTDNPSRRGD